jgi:hypothetical protein
MFIGERFRYKNDKTKTFILWKIDNENYYLRQDIHMNIVNDNNERVIMYDYDYNIPKKGFDKHEYEMNFLKTVCYSVDAREKKLKRILC